LRDSTQDLIKKKTNGSKEFGITTPRIANLSTGSTSVKKLKKSRAKKINERSSSEDASLLNATFSSKVECETAESATGNQG
jgi:hypothetical protein